MGVDLFPDSSWGLIDALLIALAVVWTVTPLVALYLWLQYLKRKP